jgi:hypothetical protein
MLFKTDEKEVTKVGFISTIAITMIVMYLLVYVFAYMYKGLIMFLDWIDGKPKQEEEAK